jgi:hypothetical protein
LKLLRRMRLGGRLYRLGTTINVEGKGSLRCAWSLVHTQQARPADRATADAIELFEACRALDEVTSC